MAAERSWRVTAWGVRGSFPRTEEDFRRYGGNTSCFSVERGDAVLVLDAGTGLYGLGAALMRRGGPKAVSVLLSHVHLDHIQGLPVFPLLSDPAAEVRLYGPPGFREALGRVFGPPVWPVGPEDCPAGVTFREVRPGEPFSPADGVTVSALAGDHPGGSLLYRLDGDGKRLVYALDCELRGEMAGRLAGFARGAGLLIWDASFAPEDLRPGWGHSTWAQGLEAARAAGAERVWMAHYSGMYDDGFLREQERRAGGACVFAREGMVTEL